MKNKAKTSHLSIRSPSNNLSGCLGDDGQGVLAGGDSETLWGGQSGSGDSHESSTVHTAGGGYHCCYLGVGQGYEL